MFASRFEQQKRERVTSRVMLDRESIVNVLTSTYRGIRNRERERLSGIGRLEVTLSRDILLFVPRTV
ncbi:MAG TPA: hypothetical protein VGK04_01810 [Thermoanaerobaculia bacterium]|jgi:hypothetical protein